MPRAPSRARFCSTTWAAAGGGITCRLVNSALTRSLHRAAPKPTRTRRAGEAGDDAALEEALGVHRHVEAAGAEPPAQLAQVGPEAPRLPPQPAPPASRVHGDDMVEVGMLAEHGRLARLHQPAELGVGIGAPQRARHRQGVDHVAQRGQLDERPSPAGPEALHDGPDQVVSRVILGITCDGDPSPAASTAARSGTVASV